jgi:hypothetical protein
MLRNIHKANRDPAHRLLQCLTVAARPLRVTELAEVLAIDFETATFGGTSKLNPNWRWEDQQQAVLSTCSGLISVVDQEGTQVIQFSHSSVKEFLTSPRLARSNSDVSRFHIPIRACTHNPRKGLPWGPASVTTIQYFFYRKANINALNNRRELPEALRSLYRAYIASCIAYCLVVSTMTYIQIVRCTYPRRDSTMIPFSLSLACCL